MNNISALDVIGYVALFIFSIGLIAVIPLVAKSKGWLKGKGASNWRPSPATTATPPTGSSTVPPAPAAPTTAPATSASNSSKKPGWFSWGTLLKIGGLILIILAGVWAYHEITSRESGGPFCSSAARSGNAKGCYRTPRSSSSTKLTTQKSVAEIESERGSFCFTGKKTPPWVQIPEGGYDLKYSTVPASAEPVTQCAYSPAKPGQNASGSKYSCDGSRNAYWFRAKAAKPDSGEVCVRYRFVLRT